MPLRALQQGSILSSIRRHTRCSRDWSSDVCSSDLIYSRGFTGGMYGGRAGRSYITRSQPDNRGVTLGTVIGYSSDRNGGELLIDVATPVKTGDGLGFEAPESVGGP